MENFQRLKEDMALFSAEERAVLLGGGVDVEIVQQLAAARRRTVLRRASDERTDAARRVLVGARVPRALADRVRRVARARGVSVYRFVVDIMTAACDDEGGSNP